MRPLVFAGMSVVTAEDTALAASPDVAGARARLLQSQYLLASARSGIVPSFITNYAQVPQGNPPGPNIISRQVTAGIQLTLGDFIAYSPAVREAAFNLASAQADLGAALATERVKVVGLYFDALKARAVALARRDALSLAASQLKAAQIRANSGDAPQLDVVRAEVAAAKATADVELATAGDLNAMEALGIETTTPEVQLAATQPTDFPSINPKLTDPQTVIALARAMRPELLSARLAADAARAAIRSARAAGFPLVTVSGGYLVGTDSDVPINAPTINAQVTIPLSPANRDRVKAAEARALEAQTKAAATERQIVLDVAASARTLGASDRASVATTRARQAAETELIATQTGYRNGASSSFEVTFARLSYSQAVVDELSALYDLEKARATLDIEVGRAR
ncbi:MAG: TolC family protein [Candidatus Eremiobacteraeota bacterium]|nr:TolC family protein [Candidatus Eremiobacteraeota bacterium]